MIVCDRDNIAGTSQHPSPDVIKEEWRKQDEALKDLRRRLAKVIAPKAVALLQSSA